MKLRFAWLSVIAACLTLSATPVRAQTDLYDNGPVADVQDAWTINFGFSVSDTMQVNGTVQGLDFWALLIPGDIPTSVEVQIGTSPFANNLFDQTVNLTSSNCFSDPFGFNLCQESSVFSGPTLNGNYWLTLSNASVPDGDPVFWNQNFGAGCQAPGCPSSAQENSVGTIPSESFTVLGSSSSTSTTGTTPEPASWLLLASGVLGAAGILRRKLF